MGYAFQSGGTGETYLDVVLYNNYYYVCKKPHSKTANNYPGSATSEAQGLWQLGDTLQLVATKILLAEYALVKNLGVEVIDMKDGQGNILFQAKNGNVTCKTGTFENVTITGKLKGSVRNPFVSAGDSFDTDYGDNVAMLSSGGGWVWAYSLPWDASQSGRKLTITNCFWNGSNSYGAAGISAPSGKYFYENGEQKTELQLNREVVELIGYGTSTTFYGWIVLKRDYVTPTYKYGRNLRCLAMGSITGSSSGASISYTSFNGGTLTTSRLDTGKYRISWPSGWFSCMANAKSRQSRAATQLKVSEPYSAASTYARATPIITGTAAPESVFGRAASNQALAELVSIFFSSAIIFKNFLQK